jgi:hypothetical protein
VPAFSRATKGRLISAWLQNVKRRKNMTNDDSYRQQAAKLRRQARRERNVSTRLDLELLAKGYDRLANQAREHRPEQRRVRVRSRSH